MRWRAARHRLHPGRGDDHAVRRPRGAPAGLRLRPRPRRNSRATLASLRQARSAGRAQHRRLAAQGRRRRPADVDSRAPRVSAGAGRQASRRPTPSRWSTAPAAARSWRIPWFSEPDPERLEAWSARPEGDGARRASRPSTPPWRPSPGRACASWPGRHRPAGQRRHRLPRSNGAGNQPPGSTCPSTAGSSSGRRCPGPAFAADTSGAAGGRRGCLRLAGDPPQIAPLPAALFVLRIVLPTLAGHGPVPGRALLGVILPAIRALAARPQARDDPGADQLRLEHPGRVPSATSRAGVLTREQAQAAGQDADRGRCATAARARTTSGSRTCSRA